MFPTLRIIMQLDIRHPPAYFQTEIHILFPCEEKECVPLQPALPFYLPQALISLLQAESQHKANPVLQRMEFDLRDLQGYW